MPIDLARDQYAARAEIACCTNLGLWNVYDYLRTKGKHYQISEGDGIFYSYSVYDNYDQVRSWAERIFLFSTGNTRCWSWFHPLLNSNGVLLVAVRKKVDTSH